MTPEARLQEQVIIEEENDHAIEVRSPVLEEISRSSSRNSQMIQMAEIETIPTEQQILEEQINKRNADLLAQAVQNQIDAHEVDEITPRENPPKKISLNPTTTSSVNKPQITSVYMSDERRSSGGGHSVNLNQLPGSKRNSGDPVIQVSNHSLVDDDMPSSQPIDKSAGLAVQNATQNATSIPPADQSPRSQADSNLSNP